MPRSRNKATFECEHVGLDFFVDAPCTVVVRDVVAATPEQIFESFLDAESWPRWALPITHVEWTSPFPLEVGSTRTVSMVGGMVGWEEFIAWDPPHRMAFRFNRSVEGGPIAFAEDYHVSDLGDGRSSIEWTMAMRLGGFSGRIAPVIARAMWPGNRLMLHRLRRYVERRAAL